MTEYNDAKLETLQYLNDQGEGTSSDYAYTYELSLQNASMRLRRCSKQGLLGRYREGREYIYYITERGVERLQWLILIKHIERRFTVKRCPVNEMSRVNDLEEDELDYDFYGPDEDFEHYQLEEEAYMDISDTLFNRHR